MGKPPYTLSLNNGNSMPLLGLGTWQAPSDIVEKAVYEAIKSGYRHIDCAYIYGNETGVGAGIKKAFQEGLCSREDLWITSKLWNSFHEPEKVEPALLRTLQDLDLDYIDLYLIHWPIAFKNGVKFPSSVSEIYTPVEMPVIDTWNAMARLPKDKVHSIGVSNFSIPMLQQLEDSDIVPVINQVECHPYLTQEELYSYCTEKGIGLTAYSPLGSASSLAGSDLPALMNDDTVKSIATDLGKSPAQVLIRFQLERGISVIPKSSHVERLRSNFASLEFNLTQAQMEALQGLNRNHRFIVPEPWLASGSPWSSESLWMDH